MGSCPRVILIWTIVEGFGSTGTISRLGERFRDGQYSLVTFLFFVLPLSVPSCPVICKSGGHVLPCPMESAPLSWDSFAPKSMIKQPFSLNVQCYKDYVPSVCVQSYARSDTVNFVLLIINQSHHTVWEGTCLKCLNGTTPLSGAER